ncbi:MAG: hypothetical protein LBI20_02550 [Holosporales bacterium]|nr:hypothetical protein [Holosporales bacterium]
MNGPGGPKWWVITRHGCLPQEGPPPVNLTLFRDYHPKTRIGGSGAAGTYVSWTKEEDKNLFVYAATHPARVGGVDWTSVKDVLPIRTPNGCRTRYSNFMTQYRRRHPGAAECDILEGLVRPLLAEGHGEVLLGEAGEPPAADLPQEPLILGARADTGAAFSSEDSGDEEVSAVEEITRRSTIIQAQERLRAMGTLPYRITVQALRDSSQDSDSSERTRHSESSSSSEAEETRWTVAQLEEIDRYVQDNRDENGFIDWTNAPSKLGYTTKGECQKRYKQYIRTIGPPPATLHSPSRRFGEKVRRQLLEVMEEDPAFQSKREDSWEENASDEAESDSDVDAEEDPWIARLEADPRSVMDLPWPGWTLGMERTLLRAVRKNTDENGDIAWLNVPLGLAGKSVEDCQERFFKICQVWPHLDPQFGRETRESRVSSESESDTGGDRVRDRSRASASYLRGGRARVVEWRAWTSTEDEALDEYVSHHTLRSGQVDWSTVTESILARTQMASRKRWEAIKERRDEEESMGRGTSGPFRLRQPHPDAFSHPSLHFERTVVAPAEPRGRAGRGLPDLGAWEAWYPAEDRYLLDWGRRHPAMVSIGAWQAPASGLFRRLPEECSRRWLELQELSQAAERGEGVVGREEEEGPSFAPAPVVPGEAYMQRAQSIGQAGWSEEEDNILHLYVVTHRNLKGKIKWGGLKEFIGWRSYLACKARWADIRDRWPGEGAARAGEPGASMSTLGTDHTPTGAGLCPGANPHSQAGGRAPRRVWTPRQDDILIWYVSRHKGPDGTVDWTEVKGVFPRRTTHACQMRWDMIRDRCAMAAPPDFPAEEPGDLGSSSSDDPADQGTGVDHRHLGLPNPEEADHLTREPLSTAPERRVEPGPQGWTVDEDAALRQVAGRYVLDGQQVNWRDVCLRFPGRDRSECIERWTEIRW